MTTKATSPSASTSTSAAGPSPRSAIPVATSRCWNTRRAAAARGSSCWCCTMTRRANTPTVRRTDCRTSNSAASRRARRPAQEGRLDRRQHEERLESRSSRPRSPGHRHRHPAGAGRHDAPAFRRQQRPPAQGLPERFRPGCDAPSAHHDDPALRPHGGSRPRSMPPPARFSPAPT